MEDNHTWMSLIITDVLADFFRVNWESIAKSWMEDV